MCDGSAAAALGREISALALTARRACQFPGVRTPAAADDTNLCLSAADAGEEEEGRALFLPR